MTSPRTKISTDAIGIQQRSFIRDGRSPVPKKFVTSKVMSANKAKNTKPEVIFRKALWAEGIKGYRLHWIKAPGRPDIVFTQKKLAIFVNGCFWHKCPNCNLPIPKSNSHFWKAKFDKNIERDRKKIDLLTEFGWISTVVWECELKRDIEGCVKRIKALLKEG